MSMGRFSALVGVSASMVLGAISSAAAAPGDFDLPNLLSTLDEKKPESIEAFIPLLPESYKDSVSYIYQTHSRQGATPEFPRIVTYGRPYQSWTSNDYLIFGIKGHASILNPAEIEQQKRLKRGEKVQTEDDVEIIRFNAQAAKFEFYRIHFTPGKEKSYELVGPNPAACMGCHQGGTSGVDGDGRPNWSRYPQWPGVYGNSDFRVGSEERANWISFVEKQKPQGRYQFFELYNRDDYMANRKPGGMPSTLTHMKADVKFDLFNGLRVARKLIETPDYERYRYAIYGALRNCSNIESFIPQASKHFETLKMADMTALKRDTHNRLVTYTGPQGMQPTFPLVLFPEFMPPQTSRYRSAESLALDAADKTHQAQRIANLRFLFEGRGLGITSWWTNFVPRNSSYGETYLESLQVSGDAGVPLIHAYEAAIRKNDPQLAAFVPAPGNSSGGYGLARDVSLVNCSALRDLSVAALSK